jgi:hypothetical protein
MAIPRHPELKKERKKKKPVEGEGTGRRFLLRGGGGLMGKKERKERVEEGPAPLSPNKNEWKIGGFKIA